MKTFLKITLQILISVIAWIAFTTSATLYGWFHTPIASLKDTDDFMDAAILQANEGPVGNIVMAVLEEGQVKREHLYALDGKLDRNTVFQVASLSKWVTSWGVMKLVQGGLVDLDKPVTNYLTRWQLPPSEFNNDGVTIRRLLSHTAGLIDELGYAGFAPGTDVQTLEASLTKAIDASPGKDGRVFVGYEPGTSWQYSGGGYTLLQLLVEEVTQESFQDYMQQEILIPLGMYNSTYLFNPDSSINLATFYDTDSTIATHYHFTSLAATSLYTSLADMEKFLQSHFPGSGGSVAGRGVLKPETIQSMYKPHGYSMGAPIWGLGTMLFAENSLGGHIIGHDGKNEPAINTAARLDPDTGNGIIVLETGHPLLATNLGSEWVFWQTGNVDLLMFMSHLDAALDYALYGSLVIIGIVLFFNLRRRFGDRTEQ